MVNLGGEGVVFVVVVEMFLGVKVGVLGCVFCLGFVVCEVMIGVIYLGDV